MARTPNRFRVAHKPTVTPTIGNWAVVQRATGHIRSRHQTRQAAQRSAAIRGSAVRQSRRARGKRG